MLNGQVLQNTSYQLAGLTMISPEATISVYGNDVTDVIHDSSQVVTGECSLLVCAFVRTVTGFFLRDENIDKDLISIKYSGK